MFKATKKLSFEGDNFLILKKNFEKNSALRGKKYLTKEEEKKKWKKSF